MKMLREFYLLISFLFLGLGLYGQEPSFHIGGVNLENIEGPWLEMRLQKQRRVWNILVFYGQGCFEGMLPVLGDHYSRKNVQACLGLVNEHGNLVEVTHPIAAINILEEQGFQLIEILSENVYLMKRGTQGPRQLIDKVEKDSGC